MEIIDIDGKRWIKKPAGGAGGGVTGFVLELIGDAPAPVISEAVAEAPASSTIEAAAEKAAQDAKRE